MGDGDSLSIAGVLGEEGVCIGCSESLFLSLSDGCDVAGFSVFSSSKSGGSGFDNGLLFSSSLSITLSTESDSLGEDVAGSVVGCVGFKLSSFLSFGNLVESDDGSFCGAGVADFSESTAFLSSDWGIATEGKGSGLFSGC